MSLYDIVPAWVPPIINKFSKHLASEKNAIQTEKLGTESIIPYFGYTVVCATRVYCIYNVLVPLDNRPGK